MSTDICSYCGNEGKIAASDSLGNKFCCDCMYGNDPNLPVCTEGDRLCDELRNGYIDTKFFRMCEEVRLRKETNNGTESEGTGETTDRNEKPEKEV